MTVRHPAKKKKRKFPFPSLSLSDQLYSRVFPFPQNFPSLFFKSQNLILSTHWLNTELMVEGGDGGGPQSGLGSKPMSTCESYGGRLRFMVELRPGETTIVSWKKLLKETTSSKSNGLGPSVSCPSSVAHQQPVSQPPPPPPALASSKQPAENEAKDSQAQAGPNRLSNVIEKIERMYAVCFRWIGEFNINLSFGYTFINFLIV